MIKRTLFAFFLSILFAHRFLTDVRRQCRCKSVRLARQLLARGAGSPRQDENGAASYLGLPILDLLIICSVGVALMDGHGHACALMIILVQFFGPQCRYCS
ncbi:MAG: hypothetical protein WCD64_06630, partial [Pseudolabrys sp.]